MSVQGDMTLSQSVTELRTRTKSCEFGALEAYLIRDRIVCGINSDFKRETSLKEVDIKKSHELSSSIGNNQNTTETDA